MEATTMGMRAGCGRGAGARALWRSSRGAAGIAACLALHGCTVIGAGIGAAIPSHERVGHASELRRGDRIEVRDAEGQEVSGTYVGSLDGELHLREEGELRTLAAQDIEQVERDDGSYVGVGLGLGLAIDMVVVLAVAASFAGDSSSDSNDSSGFDFGQ